MFPYQTKNNHKLMQGSMSRDQLLYLNLYENNINIMVRKIQQGNILQNLSEYWKETNRWLENDGFFFSVLSFIILLIIQLMFSELCSEEMFECLKLRLAALFFLWAILFPYLKFTENDSAKIQMQNFSNTIRNGPSQNQPQIPFDEFLRILSENPYSGTWLSSIKESKLLKQQNGTIQLKAQQRKPGSPEEGYLISILIFDGSYRDSGNYVIQLESSSIKTQQQFVSNHLIYETTSPMIGLSRKQKIFVSQKEKPIYINKLKFRLNLVETLKIQLLFAAEYQINIVTEGLQQKWEVFHECIFAMIILTQVIVQAVGGYWLLLEVQQQSLIANSVSPTTIKLGIAFDTAELFVLTYLIFWHNMKILAFPTYFLFILVIYLESHLYSKLQSSIKQTQPEHPQLRRMQRGALGQNSQQNISAQENSNLLNNETVKPLINVIERNQNYLMCIVSFFIFYLNNMQNYIYCVYFFIILLPQIARNCRMGSKVNYSLQSILAYVYPRLLPVLFVRFFGIRSLAMLQPRYIFCLTCIILSLVCCLLLFIQNKYGARSILPKFLIPKGYKTKFKFFMIQDENNNCIVCSSELASLPFELQSKMKQEIVYNKVVLTPCHHKFHAHCLQKWMQSRVKCPSCNCNLPPVEMQQ